MILKIALIGCGYWGTHLLRNFNNSENWDLVYACDLDENRLKKVKANYPKLDLTNNPEDIFKSPDIDVVAIATPVFSHYELSKKTLESGKHAWVEKPLTASSIEASELVKIAKEKDLILNVDHTYIYTPAVQKVKEIIESGEIGDVLYFDSVRINLGLFQHDVNVIWDLAPHDLSILEYCIGKRPISVNATGKPVVKYSEKEIANLAYLTLNYNENFIAHIHSNWLSPVKIRQIIIGGSKKMLVFDDMQNTEKIKIYDSGVMIKDQDQIHESLVQYRIGDMSSPAISNKEALKDEVDHFYNCILNKEKTKTNGDMGARIVDILEASDKSLSENGKLIHL